MIARATATGRAVDASDERAPPPVNVVVLTDEAHCFRNFRLLPGARILLRDGQPVEIGSRAFDLLHILVKSQGVVVERDAIVRHVWPVTTVDESNLRSQVSRVRKALAEHRDLLKTVPGRGYLLAADPVLRQPSSECAEQSARLAAAVALTGPLRRDASEADVLRSLLRSVLDELWEIARDIPGRGGPLPGRVVTGRELPE